MSEMHTPTSYYRTSPQAFHTRCNYLWHRRLDNPMQREVLSTSGAALVTYVMKNRLPFGKEQVTETTVLKIPIPMTNSTPQDVVAFADVLKAFRPDGHEVTFEDDTFGECVVIMWWSPSSARLDVGDVNPTGTETQCFISDGTEFARIVREFGEGTPVYCYGAGPWLISDRPLTPEHARILMEVRK